ncbi:MAG: pirin family protein [Actinomycetota bacterium]|nr:pirin family protein [Actinomycetota bacterium]
MAAIDIRRADTRFHTEIGWLDSWHSFSFGEHDDPGNTHHGLLRVLNDDIVTAGSGFGMHGHRDMEIVTWVLEGALEHQDSEGHHGVITPGVAQRMSAGTGIRHSEMNASKHERVRLLQMWVPPDRSVAPGYEQVDISSRLDGKSLVPLASGREADAGVQIHQRDATLWVGPLDSLVTVKVPDAPYVHVFVARGSATLGSDDLGPGDAVRLTDAGTLDLTAGADGAELVVWEMHTALA